MLLRCWSGGCTVQEITAAIGLTVADLFASTGRRNGHAPARGPKTYPSLDDAIGAIGRGLAIDHPGAQYRDRWHYQDAQGDDALVVVRWDISGSRKQFRPFRPAGGGWQVGDPPGKLPLYRLPELMADGTAVVHVSEGERKTNALRASGS